MKHLMKRAFVLMLCATIALSSIPVQNVYAEEGQVTETNLEEVAEELIEESGEEVTPESTMEEGEETPVEKPTLSVFSEDDEIYFSVQNNDMNAGYINLELVSKDESSSYYIMGYYLEPGKIENLVPEGFISGSDAEAGEYYLRAYMQNDAGVCSENAVLEDYLIVFEKDIITDAVELNKGEISGNIYVEGIDTSGYYSGWLNTWCADGAGEDANRWLDTVYLYFSGNRMYLDSDHVDYYEENYACWGVDSIELRKIEASLEKCIITDRITDTFSLGEHEEARVEAPSVEVFEDRTGKPAGVKITNNADVEVSVEYYLRHRDDASTAGYNNIDLDAFESRNIYLKDLLQEEFYNDGTYYFSCVASEWTGVSADSEEVSLSEYPIVIEENEVEDTWVYQKGDVSGEQYFVNLLANDDTYGYVELSCSDGEGSWESRSELDVRAGRYCFNEKDFNNWYELWEVSKVVYGTVVANEDGFYVTQTWTSSVEKSDELYEEPKTEAPTVELCKDTNGNITGVKIFNNIDHRNSEVALKLLGYKDGEVISAYDMRWLEIHGNCEGTISFDDLYVSTFLIREMLEEGCNSFKIAVYAIDYDTDLSSKDVLLDCSVDVNADTYEGKTISAEVEYNEDNNPCYYVDVNDIPKNVAGFNIYGFDGAWEEADTFDKTDDQSKWFVEVWAEDSFDISKFVYGQVLTTANKVEIKLTEIPKEKIIVTEKDVNYKKVYLLDYDHYQAFIASGGSVTVTADDIEISNENFKTNDLWELEYLLRKFKGTAAYTFVEDISDTIKRAANKYWEDFSAVQYYDTDGNVIAGDSLSKHDVVLIKYEPEIVWVDSIQLTAPEKMLMGESAQILTVLDAGQDKYPFERTPQIRYESSDPEIVQVDETTGMITAGNVAGSATITAYADEELKESEELTEIVTASVEIEVVEKIFYEEPTVNDESFKAANEATVEELKKAVGEGNFGNLDSISPETAQKISDALDSGCAISIEAVIEALGEETIEEYMAKIEENIPYEASDIEFKQISDISMLIVKLSDGTEEPLGQIKELKEPVTLSFENVEALPEGMKYVVIRIHEDLHGNETVDVLDAKYDKDKNNVTFETDKFSVYALALVPKEDLVEVGTIGLGKWRMDLDSVVYLNYYPVYDGFSENFDYKNCTGAVIWTGETAPTSREDIMVGKPNTMDYKGGYQNSDGEWYVRTHEIYAKNLGDMVYIRPYVIEKDGTYKYLNGAPYYSPELFSYDIMNAESEPVGKKNVCAALLQYGASAQVYFGHDVENLVTTIPAKYKNVKWEDYATAMEYKDEYIDEILIDDHVRSLAATLAGRGEINKVGIVYEDSTLDLAGAIRFSTGFIIDENVIDVNDIAKAEVLFWNERDFAKINSLEYSLGNYNYKCDLTKAFGEETVYIGDYRAQSAHIVAKYLGESVYFTCRVELKDGTVYNSGLGYYSPEAFAKDHIKSSDSDEVTKGVCKRIIVYSEMAKQWFEEISNNI